MWVLPTPEGPSSAAFSARSTNRRSAREPRRRGWRAPGAALWARRWRSRSRSPRASRWWASLPRGRPSRARAPAGRRPRRAPPPRGGRREEVAERALPGGRRPGPRPATPHSSSSAAARRKARRRARRRARRCGRASGSLTSPLRHGRAPRGPTADAAGRRWGAAAAADPAARATCRPPQGVGTGRSAGTAARGAVRPRVGHLPQPTAPSPTSRSQRPPAARAHGGIGPGRRPPRRPAPGGLAQGP